VINKFDPSFDEPDSAECVPDKQCSIVAECTSGENIVENHGKQPASAKAAGRSAKLAPVELSDSAGLPHYAGKILQRSSR
jgi:hypothetical protein